MTERTTDEIDRDRTAKEKELRVAEDRVNEIRTEIYNLDRQMLDLRIKRDDLREAARKGDHVARGLKMDVRALINEFFRAKERGQGHAL